MKLSNHVMNFLIENNVSYVFKVCGEALGHLLDSIYVRDDIKAISMYHETAAALQRKLMLRSDEI